VVVDVIVAVAGRVVGGVCCRQLLLILRHRLNRARFLNDRASRKPVRDCAG
jgi:hypothetical protein